MNTTLFFSRWVKYALSAGLISLLTACTSGGGVWPAGPSASVGGAAADVANANAIATDDVRNAN